MYVTENGAAFADVVTPDGAVHDERRAHYLRKHFAQARQALSDGVPLKGYFVWSLLDNFEWACGFEKRFGVIYTDYATQRRII
ncbi:MAG TPA: family 1 glycosylhydrolase, partial [Anaerolineales bacterium]|nr:family 1 glycosylhydrolase [Anaerolineales bacterium]